MKTIACLNTIIAIGYLSFLYPIYMTFYILAGLIWVFKWATAAEGYNYCDVIIVWATWPMGVVVEWLD